MAELRKKPRYQVGNYRPGVYKGRVFVKKANMWLTYETHNDTKRPDIFLWEGMPQ
jgi:hypothetical protein